MSERQRATDEIIMLSPPYAFLFSTEGAA